VLGRWRVDGNSGELFEADLAGKFKRPTSGDGRVLREQREFTIHGQPEIWRLEWAKSPMDYCMYSPDDWNTCPCNDYQYGEMGELELVRWRLGRAEQRLKLGVAAGWSDVALARWPSRPNDADYFHYDLDGAKFPSQVRARPVLAAMQLADYDQDGEASEFMLRVGGHGESACGHIEAVVVGVDKHSDNIHVFGSAEHPDHPLVLARPSQWEKVLKAKGELELVQWACGDHGSEQETTIKLPIDSAGLHATEYRFDCAAAGGNRGKLIEKIVR
jgi:hypothetical protein